MSDALPRVRSRLSGQRTEVIRRWRRQLAAAAAAGFPLDGSTLALLPAVLDALDETLDRRFRPAPATLAAGEVHAHRASQRTGLLHDYLLDVAEEAGPLEPAAAREISGAIAQALAHALVSELAAAAQERATLVVHDLRNATTAARLSLDLLRRRSALPDSPAARTLERSVQNLRDLVEGARLDALLLPGNLRPRPLGALALLRSAARGAGAGALAIAGSSALRLRADPEATGLVLTSLLRTARELDPGGRLTGSVDRVGRLCRLSLRLEGAPRNALRLSALPQLRRARRLTSAQGGRLTARRGRAQTTFLVDLPLYTRV